jgi:TetR/AcrR family transcriptional regulator, transcriptional repressor for nem operon
MATTTAPKQKSETAEQILDLAETLIQTRGYSAFSYQDIADSLGIRKASIHYHFPSKADLGVAVVDRYIARFGEGLTAIADDQSQSSMTMLDFYVQPYLQFASTPDRVCLSGALAGEMLALPPQVRERVDHFFRTHQVWLTKILERGVARGEFELPAPASKVARFVFGALQGALLVKRTTNDLSQINDVIAVMKLQLATRSSA